MIQKQLLDSGEDRLIAKYFRPLVRHPGALGLTDDAAMLTPLGQKIEAVEEIVPVRRSLVGRRAVIGLMQ